ncbi:hypothetical protein [Nonlabens ulvanivorans]|uniref:Uncharacterized protein n=1 Tax=Nonlabens ulvanivorans TaxID=906888 RepID=A0A084JZB5_NONUL|nr:hypothetical protein [Nonlabens ulvanivorans]KEZ94299.1 hypothetical protein IL45_02290 [Nonlabens ulvanivorans]PRX08670.1 hypothetical protein LY02_02920 [Nonlabens ulvanivorans]
MSKSFIKYNNTGFWISDTMIEYAIFYICKNIDSRQSNEEWLIEYSSYLEKCFQGYFASYLNLRLDEYLDDDVKKNKFIEIIDSTIGTVRNKGSFIDNKEIKEIILLKLPEAQINIHDDYHLDTVNVINILQHLKLLLLEEYGRESEL